MTFEQYMDEPTPFRRHDRSRVHHEVGEWREGRGREMARRNDGVSREWREALEAEALR